MQTFATSHKIIDVSAQGLVHAVPPTGIGYLGAHNGMLFVGNTDRNLQIVFPDLEREKLNNIARFYDTAEPLTDDRALLDLDFHDILFEKSGAFYAVNHLGIVRRFSALENSFAAGEKGNDANFNLELLPQSRFRWIPDAEHTYLVNNRLISSSSGNFKIEAPTKPGIFISMNLEEFLQDYHTKYGSSTAQDLVTLPGGCHFENFGFVTALYVDSEKQHLLFAAGQRLGFCSLVESEGNIVPGQLHWLQRLPFWCKLLFCSDDEITACGYSPTSTNEDDYVGLVGGGIARLSLMDGSILLQAPFEMEPAWGNGASPVMYIEKRGEMYCVDRFGSLYLIDHKSLEQQCIHMCDCAERLHPLGAAHLVYSSDVIFCGYHRGGYRLHCWTL